MRRKVMWQECGEFPPRGAVLMFDDRRLYNGIKARTRATAWKRAMKVRHKKKKDVINKRTQEQARVK